jgi:hypothetical protein
VDAGASEAARAKKIRASAREVAGACVAARACEAARARKIRASACETRVKKIKSIKSTFYFYSIKNKM